MGAPEEAKESLILVVGLSSETSDLESVNGLHFSNVRIYLSPTSRTEYIASTRGLVYLYRVRMKVSVSSLILEDVLSIWMVEVIVIRCRVTVQRKEDDDGMTAESGDVYINLKIQKERSL